MACRRRALEEIVKKLSLTQQPSPFTGNGSTDRSPFAILPLMIQSLEAPLPRNGGTQNWVIWPASSPFG
jgi:hypothetical protein